MVNFAEQILREAGEEAIEAIVIGARGWSSLDENAPVLNWEEAMPQLDYDYDSDYGGMDCHAIWAWTATRVLFVWQYDGMTGLTSVPRNPQSGNPDAPGG